MTLLTLVFIAVSIATVVILKQSFVQDGASQFFFQIGGPQDIQRAPSNLSEDIKLYVRIVLYGVIPVLLYVLSYLKFRKAEIKG